MNNRAALPGRPGPGIYASGGVASPRFGFVGEGASGYPLPPSMPPAIGPLRTTDLSVPVRTVTITATIKRENE